ncbi:MAG: PilN domain-containing protein [Gammaproteobacteria bacterium]|nr:PilN domain-containing protein [Gammaproteobacteria bacterium]NND60103.1 PilN domain-containing protein [Gammaproteobacteria bacterium]
MTEFDLVPREYRLNLAFRHWLGRVAALTTAVVVFACASGAALAWANSSLDNQIQQLQTQQALTAQQRTQLETLDARIMDLGRQWQLLTTLRSGAPAEEIFAIIDATLEQGDVWFLSWDFARAGVAEVQQPQTVNTGYFIVVPDGQSMQPPPAWQVDTHLNIRGQARDHSALSAFVRALFAQSQVRDVRLQRTSLRRFAAASVVEFELAVVLGSESS